MKKLLSIVMVVFLVFVLFTSCNDERPSVDNKNQINQITAKKDVSYDGYTVASNITLPFETAVTEHVQYEKVLYI